MQVGLYVCRAVRRMWKSFAYLRCHMYFDVTRATYNAGKSAKHEAREGAVLSPRDIWFSQEEDRWCSWHLGGRDQGSVKTCCNAPDSPTTQDYVVHSVNSVEMKKPRAKERQQAHHEGHGSLRGTVLSEGHSEGAHRGEKPGQIRYSDPVI